MLSCCLDTVARRIVTAQLTVNHALNLAFPEIHRLRRKDYRYPWWYCTVPSIMVGYGTPTKGPRTTLNRVLHCDWTAYGTVQSITALRICFIAEMSKFIQYSWEQKRLDKNRMIDLLLAHSSRYCVLEKPFIFTSPPMDFHAGCSFPRFHTTSMCTRKWSTVQCSRITPQYKETYCT